MLSAGKLPDAWRHLHSDVSKSLSKDRLPHLNGSAKWCYIFGSVYLSEQTMPRARPFGWSQMMLIKLDVLVPQLIPRIWGKKNLIRNRRYLSCQRVVTKRLPRCVIRTFWTAANTQAQKLCIRKIFITETFYWANGFFDPNKRLQWLIRITYREVFHWKIKNLWD